MRGTSYRVIDHEWYESNPPGEAIHASYRLVLLKGGTRYVGSYIVEGRPVVEMTPAAINKGQRKDGGADQVAQKSPHPFTDRFRLSLFTNGQGEPLGNRRSSTISTPWMRTRLAGELPALPLGISLPKNQVSLLNGVTD